VLAGTTVSTGTVVGGTLVGGTAVAGGGVEVAGVPQAERSVAAIIKKATSPHKFLLVILSSPYEIRIVENWQNRSLTRC
jgi:hypothetical protein